ncbi:hypothetical protein J8L84_19565 [Alteromonas sp. MMG017]|uniref:hypothetical protein n=1 Tax=Alteromonas sp. MMG017 TaxID=2822692 RepID=UPI001B39E1AE|nr:hypothetical protein [Alteromonas sp. MMG017]MBQ4831485.1 hypothetical protein [Alteromonas sp. MMG017]
MASKISVFSLPLILLTICSCSTSAPIVVHDQYGEMSANNELFRKEASDCALQARESVTGTTLDKNSHKEDVTVASVQLLSFFSGNALCLKTKGWYIKE